MASANIVRARSQNQVSESIQQRLKQLKPKGENSNPRDGTVTSSCINLNFGTLKSMSSRNTISDAIAENDETSPVRCPSMSSIERPNTYNEYQPIVRRDTIIDDFNSSLNNSSTRNVIEIEGYLGCADITNQIHRRSAKCFEFTLMVVGQSGLGKSTFINSLLVCDAYGNRDSVQLELAKTFHVEERFYNIKENDVNLKLIIVDTPGFGDSIDNSNCWRPILQYINKHNADYLEKEFLINRIKPIPDRRVHCCLYFISPGHGLKQLDITVMKQLHNTVNIVPIIAKADTMTVEELKAFKETISAEMKMHKITTYDFPERNLDDDELAEVQILKKRLPFAVVGSNVLRNIDGKLVRCRSYPWGTVEVENLQHNDFVPLRRLLIQTYLMDLIDLTHHYQYQSYRKEQLKDTDMSQILGKSEGDKVEIERRKELQNKANNEILSALQKKRNEQAQWFKEQQDQFENQKKQFYYDIENNRKGLHNRKEQFVKQKKDFENQHKTFKKFEEKMTTSLLNQSGNAGDTGTTSMKPRSASTLRAKFT